MQFAPDDLVVSYAEVFDDVGLAGWVWVTVDLAARPRAGIVLAGGRLPSDKLQDDLGAVTLRLDLGVDGSEFLRYLIETRDGQGSKPAVNEIRQGTLASIRALVVP